MSKSKIVKVVCASADEAANMRRALENVEVRAFLGLVGAMLPLSDGTTRRLAYVGDTRDPGAPRLSIETTDGQHQVEASKVLDASTMVHS